MINVEDRAAHCRKAKEIINIIIIIIIIIVKHRYECLHTDRCQETALAPLLGRQQLGVDMPRLTLNP